MNKNEQAQKIQSLELQLNAAYARIGQLDLQCHGQQGAINSLVEMLIKNGINPENGERFQKNGQMELDAEDAETAITAPKD